MKKASLWGRVAWVGILLLSANAFAAGKISRISTTVRDGVEMIKIETDAALLESPQSFVIDNPPKVVLDLPGYQNGTGASKIDVNQGNLRSINVVDVGSKSRIVLNLKNASSFTTNIEGGDLIISLQGAGIGKVAKSNFEKFADDGNPDALPLSDIDFRRGSDGAGRLIIGLPNNRVGVNISRKPEGLSVDLQHVTLPQGLQRKLDVTDFGTPVRMVNAAQRGTGAVIELSNNGEWEHSAYQSDNQFVVEVRQRRVDPSRLGSNGSFGGEKLSLNFQNIEVRSLLQVIADFTNFNIVTSDTVNGSLTLRLKDVPWDQALQIVLDAKSLGMRKSGNVLWIAPKDEIDERVQKDLDAAAKIAEKQQVQTEAFQLNYAKAAVLAQQLMGGGAAGGAAGASGGGAAGGAGGARGRFLSPRGSVMAEPRTNQIFITDIAPKIEEFRKLLATLDIPVRQVMIEARIVEARDTFGRSLGVRLGGGDLRANRGGDGGYGIGGSNRMAFGTSYDNAVASSGMGGTTNSGGNFVNLPAAALGGVSAGSFALSIFNSAANRFLSLELSALEADGQGKVISSPRLITADQTKAIIEQGTEIPYASSSQLTGPTVQFKKAVLKLEVTPQVTPEGNIILDLDVSKDSKGVDTNAGPAIDTRHIKTQVLVENGGTVVIGGIFEMQETQSTNKVPFLGDLPVVGNLFKNNIRESEKREMLVFITPKMISDKGESR